jgi:predicted secreted protein
MAVFAQGTQLQLGNGAPTEVFITIPACQSITIEPADSEEIDITSHSSAEGFREYMDGLLAKGKVSTKIFYDPAEAQHVAVRNLHGTFANFKIVCVGTPAETFSFRAKVKATHDEPVDKAREMTLELSTTGPSAWT